MSGNGRLASGPLVGVRVLDFGSYIAGPYGGAVLGDLGADVIKIEKAGVGDHGRHLGIIYGVDLRRDGFSLLWNICNRNKRSLALDLKNEEARAVLDRLIAQADVMVVNFPRRVRSRLRLHWEDVKPTNPRLIYASLTGYGETGPEADTPGFDNNAFFARSGILDALRYEGQPPHFSLPAQGDRSTAMSLVAAIMMGKSGNMALLALPASSMEQACSMR